MVQGCGYGSPLLSHDQFVGVLGGKILDGEHLNNLVGALASDGSGGVKADWGGLRIAATLFFHKHVICLQRIVVRQGRTKKKRSDSTIPAATNGNNPSRICSPAGRRGQLDRRSHMLLLRRTIDTDSRHARNVHRHSDASDYFSDDLCPLPSAVASRQILPTFPPH